jgi:DNA-binding CsgD family transcriptional regulator
MKPKRGGTSERGEPRPPTGLDGVRFEAVGGEMAVLSFPIEEHDSREGALVSLTNAEHEVVLAVERGESNAEIARARGTSTRTVANQLARVFRKLGVASRAELVATSALLRGRL